MTKVIFKSLFLFVVGVCLLPGYAISQFNAHEVHKDIIGFDFTFGEIASAEAPKILVGPEFGTFNLTPDTKDELIYNYVYGPGVSEGFTKAVIEYYRTNETTGEIYPDYTTIYFRITPSIINCTDDRLTIEKNSGKVVIDALENDVRTDGPLVLEELIYSENGTAKIANGKVELTPDQDYEGDIFIYYSVRDNLGKTGTGMIKAKVIDPATLPQKDELYYISYGGEPVEIDLPFDGFSLRSTLDHGVFKSNLGEQLYIPHNNVSAKETFQLKKGDLSRFVTVDVIHKNPSNSWVMDDVRYTTKGTPVTLDVTDNDLKQGQELIDHSAELSPESDPGVFTYNPPSYYQGSKKMSYTLTDGHQAETGIVTVHVNNFTPETKYAYEFSTVVNAPLVINYNIPIDDFTFEIVSTPTNGQVAINHGNSTLTFDCDEISGNNLVIYEPGYGFTGQDHFALRYCIDDYCKELEITIDVNADDGADCRCYTGCVWAGDANNDGVVNASDLIHLSYAFGETGSESVVNAENPWSGRKVEDWKFAGSSGVNGKYSDSNGNGIIDEADFDAILENYNRNHAFVPPQFLERKPYPFTLNLKEDTVFVGDLISFEVGIGNSFYPALDVNGLSYSIGFPPTFVDSSSLFIDYFSNSWFGIDEKVSSVSKQVRKGWVESAVSRLSNKAKSGAGVLGTINFIVEEDVVGGFRVNSDGVIPVTISASEIRVMTKDGNLAELQDIEKTVYVSLKKRSDNHEKTELVIYPNPAQDLLNVHMNGGHDILSYEIYNLNGQKVISSDSFSERSRKIPLTNFSQGLYILKVQTTSGVKVDRFEVLR